MKKVYLEAYETDKPYCINKEYEYKTYIHIGNDYKTKAFLFNLRRYIRKAMNKEQKRYKFFRTYSEWEGHIVSLIPKDLKNYKNMIHWIYRKRNEENIYLEAVKIILIPIYIALITAGTDIFGNKLCGLVISLIIVTAISVCILHESMRLLNFYDDFIKIAEENEPKEK